MNSSGTKIAVHVLILESNRFAAAKIEHLLPREFTHQFVLTVEEAETLLDTQMADLLICADDLPEESGLMFLARTRDKWAGMKRILMVPDPDGELFFDALREIPLLSFLSKPLEKRDFHRTIHHALWESPADSSDDDQEAFLSHGYSGEPASQNDSPVVPSTDVLILETDPIAAARLTTLLPWGFRHRTTSTIEAAETLLDTQMADLLICADDLPEESGLMFLARTRNKWAGMKRILMAPDPDGKFFFQVSHEVPHLLYLRKPVNKPALLHLLRRGLHDSLFDEEGDPEPEEEHPAISRGVLSLLTGAVAILVAGAFVFGVLMLIYELKCKLGDFFPEMQFTSFFQH